MVCLRQKTQVGGRSNRAIVARPMVCSALEDESRGDRENPESNGLGLITEFDDDDELEEIDIHHVKNVT